MNQLAERSIAAFSIKIQETNADVKIIQPLPAVICDRIRMQEAFQNLIDNALKYSDTKENKIEIGCKTDHPCAPGETVFISRTTASAVFKNTWKQFSRL